MDSDCDNEANSRVNSTFIRQRSIVDRGFLSRFPPAREGNSPLHPRVPFYQFARARVHCLQIKFCQFIGRIDRSIGRTIQKESDDVSDDVQRDCRTMIVSFLPAERERGNGRTVRNNASVHSLLCTLFSRGSERESHGRRRESGALYFLSFVFRPLRTRRIWYGEGRKDRQ